MNLATWSVRNPIPCILLFAIFTLAGLWGFQQLAIQNLPDIELPTVQVSLVQPGAAPAQLETEVARPVEDAMATLQQLKHLRTTVSDGMVSIAAQFELERDLTDALADVQDAIDRVRNDLPTDLEEPQVSKVTIASAPILIYALTHSDMSEEELSWFIDDIVGRAMLAVPGVGNVTRVGGVQREVQVTVDPVRMAALGVTAADVSRALRRVQQEVSGGRGQVDGGEQGVRTIATVRQAADLAALPLALADGRMVRLDQVATVADTHAERSRLALLNGEPSVGFQIARSRGADETRIAEDVRRAVQQLERDYPGLKATLVFSAVTYALEQYHASMQMLLEGALLAVIVIWIFLRDWRATLIGAAALPLSIIPTFAVMEWLGYSLNTISLLAMAVVVGILVDDAIVEVENVARHMRQGKDVRTATVDAVSEIALAVLATTSTLVVVFLPTAFMPGVPGLLFKQFGWTIVTAVVASLAVARLITPVMAIWLLRPDRHERTDGRLMASYMRLARWCLAHPRLTLLAGTGFFIVSLALVPLLPVGFIAAADEGAIQISVELPPGSRIEDSERVAEEVRNVLAEVGGIDSVFASIGAPPITLTRSAAAIGEVRKGTLTLVLAPRDERPSQQEIERELRPLLAEIPGARFAIGAGNPGEKMQIVLVSPDNHLLHASAAAIERELRGLSFLGSVTSTASLERPEVTIRPDPARAAEQGVSTQAIGETVRIALAGDFDAALAKLNLDRRQLDIRVQAGDDVRTDLDAIAALRVPGRSGPVPLGSVASLAIESGPSQIDRYNRERQVTISADLGGYPVGRAMAARDELPAVRNLPPSVRMIEAGDAEIMRELFSGFAVALVIGVICVYCVLVLLFKDWFQPVTILSAVPLSVGGAFFALLLAQAEMGLSALIGMVMLLGIVTKNSILLVDFAVMAQREHGMSLIDAMTDACHKRARPIVMTTLAMSAGMLPVAVGLTGDASFRQPMAIAVIGGLLTSTALSLLVVPVVFLYVSRFANRLYRRKPGAAPVLAS